MVAVAMWASKTGQTRTRQRMPTIRQARSRVNCPTINQPVERWREFISFGTMLATRSSKGLQETLSRAESIQDMLSRCANNQCCKPFLKLRDGKLFLVETERLTKPGQSVAPPFVRARKQQRHVEHYWLCDDCATQWTLIYDKERGVALAPLRRPAVKAIAAAAAHNGVA